MTADDGEAIALWRYPGPWGVYDLSEPMDPAQGFWAVVDETGALVGFACFGAEARVPGLAERSGVLDVGVGMRPELTGQGHGQAFAAAVLDHGAALDAGLTLRAVVKSWNTRSVRLLLGLGFTPVGTHAVGDTSYLLLERLGTARVSPG